MYNIITIFLIFLSCCCSFQVKAQQQKATRQIIYRQFSTEHGLSQNVVYALHQDAKGFLWVGTDHGLNRYDGYSFTSFYHNPKDINSISSNSIYAIAAYDDDRLWLATGNGLSLFNPETNKSEQYPIDIQSAVAILDVKWLSKHELLLFTSRTELYSFNCMSKQFKKIKWDKKLNQIIHYKFARFKTTKGWIVGTNTPGEVKYYDITAGEAKAISTADKGQPFANQPINYAFTTTTGLTTQFLLAGKIAVFNQRKALINQIPFSDKDAAAETLGFAHAETNDGKTYIATSIGLILLDNHTGTLTTINLQQKGVPPSKLIQEIRTVLVDKEQNVWLGTFGQGLLKVKLTPSVFQNIPLEKIANNNFSPVIFKLQHWPDDTVIANCINASFTKIKFNQTIGFDTRTNYNFIQQLKNDHHIIFDSISTIQQQILTKLFQTSRAFNSQLFIHGDSTVIRCGDVGILRYIGKEEIFTYRGYVNSFVVDSKYFWAGTASGLLRINKDFSQTKWFKAENKMTALSENNITHIVVDENENLWIGTKGGGLQYFSQSENRFYQYTVKDGLPDNVVYHILPDKKGNLWLNTNKGLCRFNIATATCRNFSKRDGLINDEFNRNGGVITADGTMYFSGVSGIDILPAQAALPSDSTNPIQLVKALVNGVEQSVDALKQLRYRQNNITIEVTTNNFNYPELIYYRYRLNNGRWSKIQGTNKLYFYALNPGDYTLEVQAGFDNYHWSSSYTIPFSIATPWWQTIWFYTILALCVITLLWLFYRYRINQLQQTIALRTQLAKDLHDDVGASLSSIHIYSSVAEKVLDQNPSKAKMVLQQISTNTREAMENMSDIIWAMNNGTADHALEKKLKNFGYDMLAPINIHCTYEIDAVIEAKLNGINARKQILLICKEAINNMAKYSEATTASIVLIGEYDKLKIVIADNGKGFDTEANRKGNGLRNMAERTADLGGTCTIISKIGEGTTITCLIPLTSISDSR